MLLSVNADFAHAQWQAYRASIPVTDERLFVQVRDRAGNVSAVAEIGTGTGGQIKVFLPLVMSK